MPDSGVAQISLFCSQVKNKRFDDNSLRILESVLVSKEVNSLIETRLSLKEFMRSESLSVVREIALKTVNEQLSVLEFFVRAFAIIGDVESCLALRYEGLLLREHKSTSCQWLQVSYVEWLSFAEHCLDNGFYAIANKACENALSCLQKNDIADSRTDQVFENFQATEKINKLKNHALLSASSHSGFTCHWIVQRLKTQKLLPGECQSRRRQQCS
ncbi:hypothetical protein SLA2020_521470 [Shorea laevis]